MKREKKKAPLRRKVRGKKAPKSVTGARKSKSVRKGKKRGYTIDPKRTKSAFSIAIADSYKRRARMYRRFANPKRALRYTKGAHGALYAGRAPKPPSFTYTSRNAVTKHYQFYGPLAWQAMERLLEVLASDERTVRFVSVEFSTGYGKHSERIGTGYYTAQEAMGRVWALVSRPSADTVFRQSENIAAKEPPVPKRYFGQDDTPRSKSRNLPRDTNRVYVDVYVKQPRGKGTYRKYDI